MAERTVSIVIEVNGADEAAQKVRRVGSAFDDLLGDGLQRFARRGREVHATMKELDDLLRRIAAGARSTGDLWKNIWREAAVFFRRMVQEMAGAWSANLGGIVPLMPAGAGNFGLTAAGLQGFGPFSGNTLLAGGSLLGGLTIGSRNRAVSVIGGLVGGIAGLLRGGGGSEKRHDAEIANRGFAQLARILEDYERFRRDFASSVNAAQQIWNQMQSQWVRPQSAPSQWPYFAAILRSMEQTEDERNRRRQMAALAPVPEFAEGGLVGTRNGMLARLHPGEFVMNRQAVDRLGVNLLAGLNQGSEVAARDPGPAVSLEPASARTLGEMLQQNPQALEEGLLVVLRRGGAASRALRQ